MGKFWRKYGKDILGSADVILALLGGLALAGMGFLDSIGWVTIESEGYAKASIPILAAIGFSLLHERRRREDLVRSTKDLGEDLVRSTKELGEQLAAQLSEVVDSVNDLASDYPYHVLDHDVSWDLQRPEYAIANRKQAVRLNRRCVAITQRARHDGQLESTSLKVGPPNGGYRAQLHAVEPPFLSASGEREWVVPLDRPWEMRELMMIEARRILTGAFTRCEGEWVQVQFLYPTDRCTLSVVWPSNLPPTDLRVNRLCGPRQQSSPIPLKLLKRTGERMLLSGYEIDRPEVGELVTLSWTWDLDGLQPQHSASAATDHTP